jgi:hypothetical protein
LISRVLEKRDLPWQLCTLKLMTIFWLCNLLQVYGNDFDDAFSWFLHKLISVLEM